MTINVISDLLREVAPLLDINEVFEDSEQASWTIVASKDVAFTIDQDEEGERLLVTAPVLPSPNDDAEGVLTQAMAFNADVEASRGAWFSLDGEDRVLVLGLEIDHQNLTADRLKSALQAFVEMVGRWREKFLAMLEPRPGHFAMMASPAHADGRGAGRELRV